MSIYYCGRYSGISTRNHSCDFLNVSPLFNLRYMFALNSKREREGEGEREKKKKRENERENNKKENQTRIFNFARNSLLLDRVYHSVCHPWSSNIAKCPSRWITLIIFKPKVLHIWFPYFVFHVSRGLTPHKHHHLCGSRSNFATFKLSFQSVILKQTRQVW